MPAAVLAAAVLVLVVAGYVVLSRPVSCTLIGCVPPAVAVVVDQPVDRPLEACIGESCSGITGGSVEIPTASDRDTVQVVVRIAGGGDEVARTRTKLSTWWPNGKRCGSPCKSARLRLTADDRLVPA